MTIAIIGAGAIAREYIKVLIELNHTPLVIGRGEKRVNQVSQEYTDIEVVAGGLHNWLEKNCIPEYAIVATPVENLKVAVEELILSGCKYVLVEKPLAFNTEEIDDLRLLALQQKATINVAFNRRNYISVIKAKELIQSDGGVSSFHFDFTEAIYRIDPKNYHKDTLRFWGISNSSHVIDTAFFLCGIPLQITTLKNGEDVKWHPAGSIFTGHGITLNQVPFTYHANWGCPGRWNIEINTSKRKLVFSPMEKLRQQRHGSFIIETVDLDYSNDVRFKPGFLNQVDSWINQYEDQLMNLDEFQKELSIFRQIFGY